MQTRITGCVGRYWTWLSCLFGTVCLDLHWFSGSIIFWCSWVMMPLYRSRSNHEEREGGWREEKATVGVKSYLISTLFRCKMGGERSFIVIEVHGNSQTICRLWWCRWEVIMKTLETNEEATSHRCRCTAAQVRDFFGASRAVWSSSANIWEKVDASVNLIPVHRP